jgi:hypothetical protein
VHARVAEATLPTCRTQQSAWIYDPDYLDRVLDERLYGESGEFHGGYG